MHCRLCINCYGKVYSECVCGGEFRNNPAPIQLQLCKDDSAPGWVFVESYIMRIIRIQFLLHQPIIAVNKFFRNREEIYPSINELFIHVAKQGKVPFY
jgi:hypothetical protein